ncbi:hypothetical protein TBLA_0J01340 [Henningerozyma blattae CBS 6284]|uniref:LCCL domain-containing protein n=1 Tax=Henningerozyma blattae (strain ATCC 34711 / CBS 6284 / DSM 70876 / NBRC 10599 / NRRL Y-10934 / UCD 77-7) TaxID=1071380 RepID=I2H9S8_HENB6|nr:hypothetical protein TBLA_0J01340 [Tetrapisispora blattae CBS 6284]CCH63130.1 hypothetical protein TBLA_0J01340 [Tetrapisispora blattae CBS 6284]
MKTLQEIQEEDETELETNNDAFLLEDFTAGSISMSPAPDPFEIESTINLHDENWELLENSSPITKFLRDYGNGPRDPTDDPPVFPKYFSWTTRLENFPNDVYKKRFQNPNLRLLLLVIYCCVWLSIFFSIFEPYLLELPYFYPKNGDDKIPIISLGCNTHLDWQGSNNECGLNGELCRPFDNTEYIIRCPALCDRGAWAYSAIAVGSRRVKYTGYEIGGGKMEMPSSDDTSDLLSYPYRADSFMCGSAVHAGIVSPFFGGCARVSLDGFKDGFPSREGKYRTKFSVAFNSYFPASFSFRAFKEGVASGCYDPRFLIVFTNIILGLPVFYLSESLYGYWITALSGYWTLVLALDPPLITDPHESVTVYELFSIGFQRLLPLCFVVYVMWKSTIRRTLENGSPCAKVLLWYPMFWLGVMNNVTFDRLPVDRLTANDLKEQQGAITAVGSIILTILICAFIQVYSLWKSGRLRKYFKIYISGIFVIVLLALIPGLTLRLHHYILGIVLIPGCATRNASAYLFQGILFGLIMSGVSRWDFASIVETDFALLRGEAGGLLEPPFFLDYNQNTPNIISWSLDSDDIVKDDTGTIDGFSLLVNDIEVYVGKNTTINLDTLMTENSEFGSWIDKALTENKDANTTNIDLYLRIAQCSIRNPQRYRGDYTNAGILEWPEGIWHKPEPGVT